MMKRLSILHGLSLMILLLLAPLSVADPMSTVSVTLTGTGYNNVTDLSVIASYSSAFVWDSLGNWASDSMNGATDTNASATIASASGSTKTESFYVHSEGSATPPTNVGSWVSYGGPYPAPSWAQAQGASQQWEFQAAADGVVTFDSFLDYSFDLQTDAQGERAYGYFQAHVQMWIKSETWLYEFCGDADLQLNPGVQDGADYFLTESAVPFSVVSTTPFSSGQEGMFSLSLVHSQGAYTEGNPVVPAPAAVLLSMVGLVSAGLKLRRFV